MGIPDTTNEHAPTPPRWESDTARELRREMDTCPGCAERDRRIAILTHYERFVDFFAALAETEMPATDHPSVKPEALDWAMKAISEKSARIRELEAEVERLKSVRITVATPHEVCDGDVTGTIREIVDQYGDEALEWAEDWGEEVLHEAQYRRQAEARIRELAEALRNAIAAMNLVKAGTEVGWDDENGLRADLLKVLKQQRPHEAEGGNRG